MNDALIVAEKQQLVKLARRVERLIAKRRKAAKALRDVEEELRQARRFLQQLAMSDARADRGELLPGESAS